MKTKISPEEINSILEELENKKIHQSGGIKRMVWEKNRTKDNG